MRIKSKKINGFDSKIEYEEFLKYKEMERKGLISHLKKLEKGKDSFILFEGFKIKCDAVKSGVSNIQSITYSPDFSFINEGIFGIDYNSKVYVEVKSKGTKTARDYSLRKRMFLQKCKENNWTFIEITIDKKYGKLVRRDEIIYNGGI